MRRHQGGHQGRGPVDRTRKAEAGTALPRGTIDSCQAIFETHTRAFARAVGAGIRVALGSDCPSSPHGTNLEELDPMVRDSSMTSWDALRAATSSAAPLLGVSDELGTLLPGKR
ncbi:MAG: amidohydrolase family protein [Actinomycetota bacterium]|nr:amidohydrolase family protein [Actinomycetota bacterium]MDQ6946897.1 amidohydrolase family protein [Actinomycetota bacterium]